MLSKLSAFALTAAVGLMGSASAATLLVHHVPAAVSSHSAALAGHVDAQAPMQMQVVLPMRNKDKLRDLLSAQYNPSSPLFRHWLSVAQFTKQFGPAKSDYDAAMAFFKSNGLKVTATAPNRYMFQVEGAASDVERVLHVKLNTYQHPTQNRTFMAPDREPTLDLAGVQVQEITGLNDYVLPYTKLKRSADGRNSRAGGTGPGGAFTGTDIRAAYYATGAKATLTGKGQSVGLLELGAYSTSDIAAYFTFTGGRTNPVTVEGVGVNGANPLCSASCGDGEQVLDIVYAIDMAPGMDKVQVYVGNDPVAVENKMATDNTSKQLSTSWGYSEHFATEDAIYQEMAAQGQSYFTATGDNSTLQASGPWPEEDANIIAVGGTDLVTASPGGKWQSEPGWRFSAAGPSLDKTILIEPYQLPFIKKKNLGDKVLRNVGDISANADFDMLTCERGSCGGGWGGTSFSSPIWAGYTALMNEYAGQKGKPTVGFLNPVIYPLYKSNKKIFHDVVGNKSGIYPAVTGYDLVGGLGSPVGLKTIKAIVGK